MARPMMRVGDKVQPDWQRRALAAEGEVTRLSDAVARKQRAIDAAFVKFDAAYQKEMARAADLEVRVRGHRAVNEGLHKTIKELRANAERQEAAHDDVVRGLEQRIRTLTGQLNAAESELTSWRLGADGIEP